MALPIPRLQARLQALWVKANHGIIALWQVPIMMPPMYLLPKALAILRWVTIKLFAPVQATLRLPRVAI